MIASFGCPRDCSALTGVAGAGDSHNYKSNNKMQSVNVKSSTTVSINYKGNDNCLLFDECNTAEPVPNTKPQRNTDGSSRASNNNRDKLDVVNVYDKNYGALYRSSLEPQQSQCRVNQIPGDDIPACVAAKPHPQKSEYLKSGNANDDYDDNDYDDDTRVNNYQTATTYNDHATGTTTIANDNTNLTTDNVSYISFSRLIALTKRTQQLIRDGFLPSLRLGLYGGGESSLSTGTTGWGTPPSTNTNNNNGNYHSSHIFSFYP